MRFNMEVIARCFGIDGNELSGAKSASRMVVNDTNCPLCNSQQPKARGGSAIAVHVTSRRGSALDR